MLQSNWQSEETGEDGHACCFIQAPGKQLLSQKSLWCLLLSPFRQWKTPSVYILSQLHWVNWLLKRSTPSPTGTTKAGPSCRHVLQKGQAISGLLWVSSTFPPSCPQPLFWAVPSLSFLTFDLTITVPIRGTDFSCGESAHHHNPITSIAAPLSLRVNSPFQCCGFTNNPSQFLHSWSTRGPIRHEMEDGFPQSLGCHWSDPHDRSVGSNAQFGLPLDTRETTPLLKC